jgi:uncharacterized protein YfaS (alpha-2-macroglobulin family)
VVADSAVVTVHPAAVYAGIKPERYIGREGQEAELSLVTVDIEGAPLPGRFVTLEVYEREWVTTKEQTAGGRRYRSEPVDTLIESIPVTTDAQAEAVARYTPQRSGSLKFVAVARDPQGRVSRSSTFLWVSGSTRATWRIRNDDVIDLIADRESYEVGDVAEVLVPAPFEGAVALVTLERGTIHSRRVEQFATTSEVLRIPITERHVPNIFVGVVLYRPPTAEDPIPRYHVGYVELSVSTETRELNVTVEPDRERARPGETVRYDIEVTDYRGRPVSAEVSVAIVDKALLSLAEETGPDGLRAFWFERGLSVATSSSLSVSIDRTNDVIAELDLGGKGGGLDAERLRQDFRNTALWEAQLRTDANGRASVELVLPDNLTTWRAQARAISGEAKVGEGESEILVTLPLLIRPALPRFLRVGDDSTLRVLVRNAGLATLPTEVSLAATGLEVAGPATHSRSIAAGTSEIFEWPATVSEAGEATLTFTSRAGDESDAVRLTLPVHLDVTPETTATGGIVTDEPREEVVYLPAFALQDGGELEIGVQASLVGVLSEELWHLRRRYNTEGKVKVASRVIATAAVARVDPGGGYTIASRDIQELLEHQHGDGGWSWGPSGPSDPTITTLVVLALGEAQRAGADVPSSRLNRGIRWLEDYVDRPTDFANPSDPNERAFQLYAITRAGSSEENRLRALAQQRRADLTNPGRAYVLLGLANSGVRDETVVRSLLNDLAADAISSANGTHWEDEGTPRSVHTSTRTTAAVLHALAELGVDHTLIDETVRWVVVSRTAQGWQGHLERAQAIAALGTFVVGTGEFAGDFDYAVELNDDEVLQGHFRPATGDSADDTSIPLAELPLGASSLLSMVREFDAPGRLYYALNLRYFTGATEIEALNRGLAVSHTYTLLDEPERPVSRVQLGDVVRVTVTVLAPADRKFVTVEDHLPGGFEPIDPSIAIVPADLRLQLKEEQREAIRSTSGTTIAPWYRWYFSPWEHVDLRDEQVTLYSTNLPRGVHEYVYFARATAPGDYFVAPAEAHEEFFPEVFGRSDSGRFVIE